MPLTPRLSTKLQAALGHDATEDLVTWLEDDIRDTMRADFAELRQELHAGFSRMDERFHALETTLRADIHKVDLRVAETKADLMRWSFVFWVGAVSAIAVLAGVMK